MTDIPEHIIEAVRELARRGKPLAEIAFMTRLTEKTVREILSVITPEQPAPASGAGAPPSNDRSS